MAAGSNDTRAGVARRLSAERGRGGAVDVLLDGVRIGGIVSYGGARPGSTVYGSRIYAPFGRVVVEGASVRSVLSKVAGEVSSALRAGAAWEAPAPAVPAPNPELERTLALIASAGEYGDAGDALSTFHREDDLLGSFLHGRCHQLAVALHEATGLPIHAYLDGDGEGRAFLLHAFVLDGDMVVDAGGRRPLADVLDDFEAQDPDAGSDGTVPMTAAEVTRWGEGKGRAVPAREAAEARAVAGAIASALASAPGRTP